MFGLFLFADLPEHKVQETLVSDWLEVLWSGLVHKEVANAAPNMLRLHVAFIFIF